MRSSKLIFIICLLSPLAASCTGKLEQPAQSSPSLLTPSAALPASTLIPTQIIGQPASPMTILPSPSSESSQSPLPRITPNAGVQRAMEDLARRLHLELSTIQVVSITNDDFPSGDLGCPASGTPSLPQPAFVTGQVVLFDAHGARYIYHIHGGQVAFCGLG
jgi:hypothetical protein